MLKSLALVSVLTTVAFAQTSSNNATTNPLIPAGISDGCSTFLKGLDSDTSLKSCLSALNTATSPFAPGSTVTPTSATVTSALGNLCGSSVEAACSESLIRSKITAFYTSCTNELTTNKVKEVITMYDTLYSMSPMRSSVCSKDDSGSWCVMSSAKSTSGEAASPLDLAKQLALLYTNNAAALKRRAATSAVVPNMTTYHDTNLPFLFYTPSLDSSVLCTTCLRQVLTSFINFESNVPYAPGIGDSQLLSTQTALYSAVQEKCPAGFLGGAVQAAGGLSGPTFGSGAVSTISSEYRSFLALALGVVTLAVSVAL